MFQGRGALLQAREVAVTLQALPLDGKKMQRRKPIADQVNHLQHPWRDSRSIELKDRKQKNPLSWLLVGQQTPFVFRFMDRRLTYAQERPNGFRGDRLAASPGQCPVLGRGPVGEKRG